MRASLLLLALLSAAPFGRCKAADPSDGSAITKSAAEPPSAGAQSSSAEALRTLVQAVADADRGEGPLAVAEKLVPQEDPNYKAWSQHLRDDHSQWIQEDRDAAPLLQQDDDVTGRRRTQAATPNRAHAVNSEFNANNPGAAFYVARLSDDTDHGAAEIRDLVSFTSTSGPITGRNPEDGSFIHDEESPEGLRYARLRSVFSSSSCDDPLALNHGSSIAACTYR